MDYSLVFPFLIISLNNFFDERVAFYGRTIYFFNMHCTLFSHFQIELWDLSMCGNLHGLPFLFHCFVFTFVHTGFSVATQLFLIYLVRVISRISFWSQCSKSIDFSVMIYYLELFLYFCRRAIFEYTGFCLPAHFEVETCVVVPFFNITFSARILLLEKLLLQKIWKRSKRYSL